MQHQARRDNMADVAAKDGSQVSDSKKSLPLLSEVEIRIEICLDK